MEFEGSLYPILAGIGVLIICLALGLEYLFRRVTWSINSSHRAVATIQFYTAPIHRQPGKAISFRLYGPQATLQLSADFRLNNMGFFSDRDYKFEREADEFRIVVIGGEQTASSVAHHSWPDLLEDKLNDLDSPNRYKVFNIAWPDAGPEHYVNYWRDEGHKFDPDLVIVNYVEIDFNRTIVGAPLAYKGQPIDHEKIQYRLGPSEDEVANTVTAKIDGSMVTSYRDPAAIPARPYGFFVTPGFLINPERVKALQKRVVDDMIAGAIPRFGGLLLRALLGRLPVIRVWAERAFDQPPSEPVDRQRMIDYGVANFGWLVDNIDNLLLTHNFNAAERELRFDLTEAMIAQAPGIKVVDMRRRIPSGVDDSEYRSWFHVPYLPEKWSDRGHDAYGSMMAGLVLERRRERKSTTGYRRISRP